MYSEEEIKRAKEIIVEGISLSKSLKTIMEENKELPSRQTIYNWLNSNHEHFDSSFLDNYTRAREDAADLNAEEVNDIANKTLDGTYKPDQARVAIDAKKWTAGVKKPKKYGSKIDVTSKGESINDKKDLSELSDEELLIYKQIQSKIS